MARGKYLSLEEARKMGKMGRFAKEHPATGNAGAFDGLIDAMAKGEPPTPRKAKPKPSSGLPRPRTRTTGEGT